MLLMLIKLKLLGITFQTVEVPTNFIYVGLLALIGLLITIVGFLIRGYLKSQEKHDERVTNWLIEHEKKHSTQALVNQKLANSLERVTETLEDLEKKIEDRPRNS